MIINIISRPTRLGIELGGIRFRLLGPPKEIDKVDYRIVEVTIISFSLVNRYIGSYSILIVSLFSNFLRVIYSSRLLNYLFSVNSPVLILT